MRTVGKAHSVSSTKKLLDASVSREDAYITLSLSVSRRNEMIDASKHSMRGDMLLAQIGGWVSILL